MHDSRPSSSVEQRRKLLKGALAASGVVTMGYSGAALASFDCVGKNAYTSSTFLKTALPDPNAASWAWKALQVFTIEVGGSPTSAEGVQVGSAIYQVDYMNSQLIAPPSGAARGAEISDKFVYALVYFDTDGTETGVYAISPPSGAPAAQSCLASINPGLTGYTYGG